MELECGQAPIPRPRGPEPGCTVPLATEQAQSPGAPWGNRRLPWGQGVKVALVARAGVCVQVGRINQLDGPLLSLLLSALRRAGVKSSPRSSNLCFCPWWASALRNG